MDKKLTKAQMNVLQIMTKRPVEEYGKKLQLRVLRERGLVVQRTNDYRLTAAGAELLNIPMAQIDYNYALWELNALPQLRHNMLQVDQRRVGWSWGSSFAAGEYEFVLEPVWSQRSFEKEVEAVGNYMEAAARLCLAEMKSGLV